MTSPRARPAVGGRRAALDEFDAHARFARQREMAHDAARQRQRLAADAQPRAPHAAVANQRDRHALGGRRRDREADALRRQDHRRVDADDVAARVDQRSAGIAGIERRVGLQHVVEQAAGAARASSGPSALTMPAVTVC